MDLNKFNSKSFDNQRSSHDRSTVFDAMLEQAELSFSNTRPKLPPMSLSRKPISQRSSNTFESEVFKPPAKQTPKLRLNQPQDHPARDFNTVGQSEYYKKSLASDFKPDFQPKFTYKPGWEISHPGFESKNHEEPKEDYLVGPADKRGNKSGPRRERLNNRLDRLEPEDDDMRDEGKNGIEKTSRLNRLEKNQRLDEHFNADELNKAERLNRMDGLDRLRRNKRLEQSQIIERNEAIDKSEIFDRDEIGNRPKISDLSESTTEKRVKFSEPSSTKTLPQTSRTPINPAKDSSTPAINRDRPAPVSRKTDQAVTLTSESSQALLNKSIIPNPCSSQNSIINPAPNRSHSSNNPICLHLSGLSASTSEFSIRELCKNVQIIEFKSFRNHITGTSSSTASITVRANETSIASVRSALEKQGLKIEASSVSLGKKNNYSELAHVDFLDQYVNRESSKTPIKHHLETSQDVFGSSPGVGRYHSGKKIRDKQAVVLQTWNFVKNLKKEERLDENFNSLPNYMRSTQSSVRKCKKLN